MTREEAVLRVPPYRLYGDQHPRGWLVDSLIELGVLKIDEPKTTEQEADELLSAHFIHGQDVIGLLHRNGFKIVKA